MDDRLGADGATVFRVIDDPAAILLVDPDEPIRVDHANPAFATALTRDVTQLAGSPLGDLYDPHVAGTLAARIREAVDEQRDVRFESVRELADGRRVHRFMVAPLDHGRALLIERDHSVERAAVDELRDLQQLTTTGVWSWRLVTDDFHWSEEFGRIIGREGARSIGIAEGLEIVHPDDRDRVRIAVAEVQKAGGTLEVWHRVVRPDGEERHVCSRLSRATDRDGRPTRMYGTMQDLTDRLATVAGEETRRRIVRQQARALQLNDDVIQSLARAWLALDLGRHDDAWDAVAESMSTVRQIVGELLQSAGELRGGGHRGLRPGDLAHLRASEPSSSPAASFSDDT